MSDTVPGAILVASLNSGGPTFLPLPEPVPTAAVHVHGALHAEPGSASLLVEFRSLAPDLPSPPAPGSTPDQLPATVSGYIAIVADTTPNVIAGALQQAN